MARNLRIRVYSHHHFAQAAYDNAARDPMATAITALAPGKKTGWWCWGEASKEYLFDPDELYGAWPHMANNGLIMYPSGCITWDDDRGKDNGYDGVAAHLELAYRYTGRREIPETCTQQSPHGGHHYIYNRDYRKQGDIACSQGTDESGIAPGIDIQARGGLIIGAGSVIGGRMYTTINPVPRAQHPDWMEEIVREYERTRKRAYAARGKPKTAVQQTRDSRQYRRNRERWAKRPMALLMRDIEHHLDELAATPAARNPQLYKTMVSVLAPAIAGGRLDKDDAVNWALGAMDMNGGLADNGEAAAMRTIRKALAEWGL